MFSNNGWNRHTVRYRIVFYYLVSSLLVLGACSSGLLYLIHRKADRTVDEKLRYFRDEFEYEYLSGREEIVGAMRVPLRTAGVPAEAILALRLKDGGLSCIVTNAVGGRVERRLASDGTVAAELACTTNAIPFMNGVFNEESHGEGMTKLFLLLSSPGDTVLARSSFDDAILKELLRVNIPRFRSDHIRVETVRQDHLDIRQLSTALPDGNILTIGYNTTELRAYLLLLIGYCFIAFLLSVLLDFFLGTLLARKFTRGLDAVAAAARAIEAGDTSVRVPPGNEGMELELLAKAFNGMCDANEKMMAELRMISDNIAHDLRTPLTRMRGEAEIAITDASAAERLAGDIAETCTDMLEMINTMLDITQTSYAIERSARERLDIGALISHVAMLYATAAEDRGIAFVTEIPDRPLYLSCHSSKIQQLVGNLLDNALKFTSDGGRVSLRVAASPVGNGVEITVSDTGCGIAASDLPYIYNRFFRADASRTRPGNGLGLALVHAIVTAYGGKITVDSAPGRGSTFTVRL